MAEHKTDFPSFIGPSNTMRVPRYDCQRTVNMYLEMTPVPNTAKGQQAGVLIGTPGLKLLWQFGTGPIRAIYNISNSAATYVVSGSGVYLLATTASTPLLIGNLSTSTGYVSVADNGIQVVFVDGTANGYYSTLTGTTLTQIVSANFYAASQVTFQDGYFIFAQVNSIYFFLSDLYAVTFPALNIAGKTGGPDLLVGLISNNRELYLFGTKTTEIWWDSGASGSTPFQRQDGKFIHTGCLAQATIARIFNTICWLGTNPEGGAIVYQMQNDAPVRISNHAVEYALQQLGTNLIYATAYTKQIEGHYFYVLNCTGLNTTWVYDLSTGTWFEQQSDENGNLTRHIGQYHSYFNGIHLIGDYQDGTLYQEDYNTYTDNGAPIKRIRQAPHFSMDLNRLFYYLFEIDFMPGQGLSTGSSNNMNPTVYLEISNDGGQTFGSPVAATLGAIGKYYTRARWQRLGSSRDRVFRVSTTDNIKFDLLSAKLDFEIGQA